MNLANVINLASPAAFWLCTSAGGILGVYCFWGSFRWLRHTRIIEDTPTSKVRSAAQGYTELEGRARVMSGEPVIAPLTDTVCAWYSYKIEERSPSLNSREQNVWHTIQSGTSDAIFYLEDDTGRCIIDPDSATVTPSVSDSWCGDSKQPFAITHGSSFWLFDLFNTSRYRYSEQRIQDGDTLYTLGMFLTLGAFEGNSNIRNELRDLLSHWKRDKKNLLKRFDLNQDGRIDEREWEIVRKAAEKEVANPQPDQVRHPQTNVLKNPTNPELPFILSATPQALLIAQQRRKSALFALFFLILGATTVWASAIRLGLF